MTLLSQHSAKGARGSRGGKKTTYINDESALHRELYGRGPCFSEAGGTNSQLALLSDSSFVFVSSPSTVYFEDRPKNYSVLTHRCPPHTHNPFHKAGVPNSGAKMTHCCYHGSAGADAPTEGPSLPVTSCFAVSRFPVCLRRED